MFEIDECVGRPQPLAQILARDNFARSLEQGDEDLSWMLLEAEQCAIAVNSPAARSSSKRPNCTREGPERVCMIAETCRQCSCLDSDGQCPRAMSERLRRSKTYQFTSSSPAVHTRGIAFDRPDRVNVSTLDRKETQMTRKMPDRGVSGAVLLSLVFSLHAVAQGPASTAQADKTREVSTEELQTILANRSATVLDARPSLEFAISHIPGSVNVAPKPGVPMSSYVSDVAEIGRLLHGNKAAPLVLYCNGPHCGKSKRLAAELLDAGYSDVRRYQLGIPTWRAAGGVCEVELEGIRHIVANDGTAVVVDARESADFQNGTLRGARNIPRSLVLDGKDVGEVKRAKDDGRLPMEDHNTRILVIGADGAAARYVAEALAREASTTSVILRDRLRPHSSH